MKKLLSGGSVFVCFWLLFITNASATLYWDPDANPVGNDTNTGVGLGGSGTWTNTPNWYFSGATDTTWTNNDTAVFWGSPGTYTVTNTGQGVANLTFKIGGYTITGGTITNTATPSLVEVDAGTTTIASTIVNASGTSNYTVFGGGTLNLTSGGNNQLGTITITTNTTLEVPNFHPIGAGSAGSILAMDNGGTLRNDSTSPAELWCLSGYTISLGTGGGVFNATNSSSIFLCTNTISGAGSLTKNGPGEIRMVKASTYTGGLIVNNGLFTAGHSAINGANTFYGAVPGSANASAITLQNGGVLRLAGGVNVALNAFQGITLGTGGGTLRAVTGLTLTGASPIVGNGDLTVGVSFDNGTVILSGTNSYTGRTIVNGGTVTLNNVGGLDTVLGTAPGSIVTNQLSLNGCTLILGTAANLTLSANRGITLTGVNTNSTTTKDLTIPGNIAGTGSLIKTNAGGLNLSGTNTFSGGFTILGGTINLNGNDPAGHSNIVIGPTAAAVTLRTTATSSTVTNNIVINGGGTSDIDTFTPSGSTLTYSGLISGSGPLFRGKGGGAGNIIISGNNTGYSGQLNLYQGLLTLGNKNALGTGPLLIGPGAVAVFLQANTTLTGVNAVTNSINIASTNKSFTIGGSSDLEFAGPVNLASTGGGTNPGISVTNTGATIISGVISGPSGIGFTNSGTGTLTLAAVNTYTGNTTINGTATLALGSSGSIDNSPVISIGAGATFDVSAIATYTLSASTSLSASGTVSAATIKGGTTVSLGSRPITLAFDGTHPALTISQGGLVLNGNTFTVTGSALPAGVYTLIQQASGSVSSSGSFTVNGSAVAGKTASISVIGGSVNLIVNATPAFSGLTAAPSVAYGAMSVNLGGTVSAGATYPTNGETVTASINGHAVNGSVINTNGGFTITYNDASLPTDAAGSYTITYSYAGNSVVFLNAATNNTTTSLTIAKAPLTVTADSFSRAFGATNPVFTVAYTNFVNGETLGISGVTGNPVLAPGADTNSDVGNYTITNSIGTLAAANYSFNLVNGTLTVTNAFSTNAVTGSTNVALPATPVIFTSTVSTLAPSLAVPTNSVQFLVDGVTNGAPVFPTGGVAAMTNSSLSHGNHTIEADYSGDTNSLGATNIVGSTNTVSVLINTPPVAGAAGFARPRDIPLNINISNLLTNATDADGDVISLVSVDATSTNGATINNTNSAGVTNGFFSYTPPGPNGNVTDTFTYTVQDSFGATSSNLVTVSILPDTNGPSVNITGITTNINGTVQINFAGIPNRNYLVQATTNLTPTIIWATLNTNQAGTNGLFQYIDLDATNFSSRYYRTSTP